MGNLLSTFITHDGLGSYKPYNPHSDTNSERLDISSHSLHTTAFPCRVLPHSVVDKIVIQKREVIIKCYGPTAGLRGRVFRRKSPVAREVVKDFVIIGLGLPAQSGAVLKNHFLTGAVAQTKI